MTSVEDDSSEINEENPFTIDNLNNIDRPVIDYFSPNNRSNYKQIIEKIKRVMNIFSKFYTKIFGILFFVIFFYGFIELVQDYSI